MGQNRNLRLRDRLESYTAAARAGGATRTTLGKRLGNWPVYAAATGSAMAMATNASAGVIYSGIQNLTASVSSVGLVGGASTNHGSLKIPLSTANGVGFAILVDQDDLYGRWLICKRAFCGRGGFRRTGISRSKQLLLTETALRQECFDAVRFRRPGWRSQNGCERQHWRHRFRRDLAPGAGDALPHSLSTTVRPLQKISAGYAWYIPTRQSTAHRTALRQSIGPMIHPAPPSRPEKVFRAHLSRPHPPWRCLLPVPSG